MPANCCVSKDPDYRPPSQARDLFTPELVKPTLRWVTTKWQDLVRRTPEIRPPLPPIGNGPLVDPNFPGDPWEISPTPNDATFRTPNPGAFFDLSHQPQSRASPSASQ